MAAGMKRKRGHATQTLPAKRRPSSPEKDADSVLSDADMLAAGDTHAPHSNDLLDESEEDEEAGTNEEQWAGLGGEAATAGSAGEHPGTHKNQPPKGQELRNIKDASELYRSTSFKLQIDALLPNVRPKYSRAAPLDRFLLQLHAFLNALPSSAAQHPLEAARDLQKKGISVPFALPAPTAETNWKVAFERPAEIVLALFQEKDYLHSRFFHKRAYYLSVIAAAISDKSGMNVEVFFESPTGDPRLTTLILRPRNGDSETDFSGLNAEIRIIPVLSPSSPIPLQRLSPARSNIRTSGDASDTPTPLYNSAIALCTAYKRHFLGTHNLKESVPAFADALALLRVWANQRGYGAGDRLCVRGFERRGMFWVSVLELLVHGEESAAGGFGKAVKRKPLGKGLSSYQLFKAALDFLARHDFSKDRVFVKSADGHRFPPETYASHEAVFVDSSSTVNMLAASDDPFSSVFLKEQRDIASRFDVVLRSMTDFGTRVDLSSAKLHKPSQHAILEHGSAYNALIATMLSALRTGFGNRTKAVAVLHPSPQARPLSQANPSNPSIVYVGLILDTEHAFRLVDHGPAAAEQESEAARQFKDFWGDKAELRRFKDGSIVESVVWAVGNQDERAQIPTFIVRHVLKRHCGIADDAIHAWQGQFDSVLRLPESVSAIYQTAGVPAGFKAAMTAFDNLVRAMKALDDKLPLAILNVSPVAEALRYTSVHSPVSVPASLASALPPSARYLAPMHIVVEFEKSARWPDDLRAIQKIKLAFFETLATALMATQKGLRAAVSVHDGGAPSEIRDQASLEIVTAEGWAFHARIWHDREATLLERAINDKPHISKRLQRQSGGDPRERQAALDAQEVYRRRFIHAPRHHRAVAALNHRFPAFSGTVRLVKRWFASHWLLRGHVSEEAVELLCAGIFLRHSPVASEDGVADRKAGVPGSKERGFALAIELLKDWDWSTTMFVPLYGSDDAAGSSGAAAGVIAGAKAGVWTLPTERDPDGHMWTAKSPDAIVARRVRALAKATWECLGGIESRKLDVAALFAHPTEHYDFIVELDPAVLPRYHQNIQADASVWARKGKYANARADDETARLLPGFDPARLLYDDLKARLRDCARDPALTNECN
ncbi:predicted protein [Postia placenta Mad-698-R]|uniref:U3 small nucleolar RNA-associated protein 22 n=1 Tax=Postia placenta MAD-698-R-SB12 TaxID=670580 RepID=A0A1X6N1G5_9APHY|nr:hypothetical protein POSPLADRAFT_1143624 [Postia placenta MAD-698-R-SB12]EED77719.1 predicted protein [Postia placenta Mad-698-R]OSX62458.1 hypothetical protein POSPLADRAFT_1143624 [Postia placenta MAD-698-R-SB12]